MTTAGNIPATETPTQSLEAGRDTVSQGQQQLDTVGESFGSQDQTSVTRQEFDAMQAQNRELTSQIRGLQGSLQRTTNSLNDMNVATQQQQTQNLIESLPEEARPAVEALQQQWSQQFKAVQEQISQQSAEQPAEEVTEETRQFVADQYGLNPYDSRINYSDFLDSSQSEGQRTKALMDSIYAIRGTTQPAPVQTQPASQQQQVVLPQPDQVPAGAVAGFNSDQDVIRAYIEGRIDLEARNEALTRMRSPLL